MKAKRLLLVLSGLFLLLGLNGCGGGGGGGGESGQPLSVDPSSAAAHSSARTISPAADFPYQVTVLESLGEQCYAVALNDNQQVVGNYLDAANQLHAFIWDRQGVATLAQMAQVTAINHYGQAVGWLEDGRDQAYFYDSDGVLYYLPEMAGASRALAVNDLGQTAGRISGASEQAFFESEVGVEVVAPELMGYAVGLNESGEMLIKGLENDCIRSYLWSNGTLVDLGALGGEETQAEDINAAGQVVGWSQTATGATHAFLWEDGQMQDLGTLAGDFSAAVAINDRGQVLIKSSTVAEDRTLLYAEGRIVDLGNFGVDYAVAADINNFGEIVGWLQAADGSLRAFLAVPR